MTHEKVVMNGKPAGAYCSFSADTDVATTLGSFDISEIEIGDVVLAYNEELGEIGEYEVTAVWSHLDDVLLLTIDGEVLETTDDHPFYTDTEEWVAAGDLDIGDQIQQANGSFGTVETVTSTETIQPMYNLTIEDAHTYFVGDGEWLVHNSCPPRNPDDPSFEQHVEDRQHGEDWYDSRDLTAYTPKQGDIDLRGTDQTWQDAVDLAFQIIEGESGLTRSDFVPTDYSKDVNGKTIVVEYTGPRAEVAIDFPHQNGTSPDVPHINYSVGRGTNRVKGHIFVNWVPTGRPPTIKDQ